MRLIRRHPREKARNIAFLQPLLRQIFSICLPAREAVTSGVDMYKSLTLVIATFALVSCSTLQKVSPSHQRAQERTRELERLQLTTMRYSDQYRTRVVEGVNSFQSGAVTPEERLTAQNWKVLQVEAVYIDAGGPNPALNALDLVVLATLSRMVIDDEWAQYGTRIELLRKAHHDLEQSAWDLAKPVLSDAQSAQLRDIIARWRERHPTVRSVGAIHFIDFAQSIGEPGPGEDRQGRQHLLDRGSGSVCRPRSGYPANHPGSTAC